MVRDAKPIRTPRLRLVPVDASNAGTLWELMQNPELRTYQDLPEMERHHFAALAKPGPGAFHANRNGLLEWLIEADDGGAIGWVSLRIGIERPRRQIHHLFFALHRARSFSFRTAEIGYSLLAEYRGRGYATEAVKALVEEAFTRRRFRRLHAYCMPDNHASRALLRRVGFKEAGVLRGGASLRGRKVDIVAYSLEAKPAS